MAAFDVDGQLTRDAGAIEASGRPLPIGFWKGSALALMLDLLAALLSEGKATHQIATDPERETQLSRVFIAFDSSSLSAASGIPAIEAQAADQIIGHFQSSPHAPNELIRYPGYRVLKTREENMKNGVLVEPSVWEQIKSY